MKGIPGEVQVCAKCGATKTTACPRCSDPPIDQQFRELLDYHGCLTGDCPHVNFHDCEKAIGRAVREMMEKIGR